MPLYLDACALAKRYLREGNGSKRMVEITGRFKDWGGFVVSEIIEPEVISALAKHAREQPEQHHEHYFAQHPKVVEAFRRDLSRGAFTILSVTEGEIEQAAKFLRDNPKYDIGAADAIHLVTALKLLPREPALVMVTADIGLVDASKSVGIPVYNPQTQHVERLEQVVALAEAKATGGAGR
jgi:predicted nucleic acid-binding protein